MLNSRAIAAAIVVTLQAFSPAGGVQAEQRSVLAERISRMVGESVKYPSFPPWRQSDEGDVLVGFVVDVSGTAQDVQVVEGSRHKALDLAAIAGIEQLCSLPKEAVGKHTLALVQFRVGPDATWETDLAISRAIASVLHRWPDALVAGRYIH